MKYNLKIFILKDQLNINSCNSNNEEKESNFYSNINIKRNNIIQCETCYQDIEKELLEDHNLCHAIDFIEKKSFIQQKDKTKEEYLNLNYSQIQAKSYIQENVIECEDCNQMIKINEISNHILCHTIEKNNVQSNEINYLLELSQNEFIPCDICNIEIQFKSYVEHIYAHDYENKFNETKQRIRNGI